MSGVVVVGIDVGGDQKGFHAVSLRDGQYFAQFHSLNTDEIVDFCRQLKAVAVCVDAPCSWRVGEDPRAAERQMALRKISSFSTPIREKALGHRLNHYGWMFSGERLYQALKVHFHHSSELPPDGSPIVFETYPHAIAWHLTGGKASAKYKSTERRKILIDAGVSINALRNIDTVDAALCALVAHRVATNQPCHRYGDEVTGHIVVPV